MESIDSWILKKKYTQGADLLDQETLQPMKEAWGACLSPTTCVTATSAAPMGHPIGPEAQPSRTRKFTTQVVQILCRLFVWSVTNLSTQLQKG